MKLPNLHTLIKHESITSQKFGSCDFSQIANSVLKKGKSAIPLLFDGPKVLSSAHDWAKLFSENFSKNSILDDSAISLRVFLCRTNLKLHNISLLNWIGVLTLSLLLKYYLYCYSSKKIGVLIRSMKFLSREVAPYLYKSTICPCMEYCCHVWAGAPICYLELLDKLQKRICRTVGPSLAASLKTVAHCWNLASLSLFYKYYFGRCSSELLQLVPLPFLWGRSTRYSDRLHDYSV